MTIDNPTLAGSEAMSRLAAILSADPARRVSVLFVCLGNICRSPAAQGVMQSIVDEAGDSARWEIDSAGTGRYHIGDLPDRRMRIHAARRGLTLDHICRQAYVGDFSRFDLIIAMDDNNLYDLRQLAPDPESEKRVLPMAAFFGRYRHQDYVPDPYYQGAEGFETVLDLLDDGCRNLYDTVTAMRGASAPAGRQ